MNQDAPEGRGFLSQGSSSGTWTQLWHKRPLQALTEWWERPTLIDPKTEVHGDREITEPCPQTLHKYIALVPGILKKKCPRPSDLVPVFRWVRTYCSVFTHTVHPVQSELAQKLAHLSVWDDLSRKQQETLFIWDENLAFGAPFHFNSWLIGNHSSPAGN